MPKFSIPEPFREGFYHLARISRTDANVIAEELSNVKVGEGPEVISERIYDKKKIDKVKEILITIFSLTGLLDSERLPFEETVKDLVDSYIETDEPKLSKEKKNSLEKNLLLILANNEFIRLTFKAHSIKGEYQKILTNTRIISDARFIFSDNEVNSSNNSLIIHQLKVEYREDNQTKQTFFALDKNDLEKLSKQIDRAKEKETLIRESFGKEITFIDPKE